MKHLFRILLTGLIAGILLPVWGASTEQPSLWAQDAVSQLKAWGRIDPALFSHYQSPLSRQELASLCVTVYEGLSGEPTEGVSDELKHTFRDTADLDVLQAWKLGIVSGNDRGYFRPDSPATREDFAVAMVRLAQRAGKSLQLETQSFPKYKDSQAVSPWAKEAVEICLSQGIISGAGDGRLYPKREVTREQGLKMIVALIKLKGTLDP